MDQDQSKNKFDTNFNFKGKSQAKFRAHVRVLYTYLNYLNNQYVHVHAYTVKLCVHTHIIQYVHNSLFVCVCCAMHTVLKGEKLASD